MRIDDARSLLVLSILAFGCGLDEESPVDETVAELAQRESSELAALIGTAAALPIDDDPDEPPYNRCLEETTGMLTATPTSVAPFQNVTLTWKATVPLGCTVRIFIGATQVAKQGTLVMQPQANSSYRLRASVSGVGESVLVTRNVTVTVPTVVTITANNQVPLFVQAVQSAGRTVTIANHVQLDLSHRESITIAPNVTIRSGRGRREAGALLFTTTRPDTLFDIPSGSSNVRITGVRIHGPDMNRTDERTTAIAINSAVNVQIDHNELAGWAGAVDVKDDANTAGSQSPFAALSAHTVNVTDNFIHHNQTGDGYGVVSGYGAHPYIARNTFEWNRHAIAGDGRPGTGYTAYHNLVLEEGGLHYWVPVLGFWVHTHQFDMHGRNSCGIGGDDQYDCGPAGHITIIRHNTFFYTHDDDIKLRGTPTGGMFVGQNVFVNFISFLDAITQAETGLVIEPGNISNYNGKVDWNLRTCDFDGDGVNDTFMATGQNWWLRSGTTAPWTFLNASAVRVAALEVGHFDGDNRCDVRAGGVVYPGGTSTAVIDPWLP
jgi:hypothetical protein